MKLIETAFDRAGRAVGVVVVDSVTGTADFLPRGQNKAPPGRPWPHVDELKKALALLYGKPQP